MASPFAFFRKNQRAWMAAIVVVAIFSFVILPNFDQSNRSETRRNSQTLISWKGGKIDAEHLQKMQQTHLWTYRIFSKLANEVVQAGGTPNVPGFAMGPQGLDIGIEQPNDQSALQIRLFGEAARKHGVVVDDKTIDQFIQKFCDRKVSGKRFDEIVREQGGGGLLSKFDMYQFLRDEISKQLLVQMGYAGISSSMQPIVSPSKNWMNYQKFQQRTKIEAYPVFVDNFLAKVTNKPSEQELRAIYDKGKDLLQQPNSPEPGFRQYYRTNIEFLVADQEAFRKEEEAKLSEDFLKETYEKRVAEQGAYKVPVEEAKPTEPASTTEKPTEVKAEGAPSTEMKPVDAKGDAKPTSEPNTDTPVSDSKADKPAADKPAADKPAEDKPADDKKPATDKSNAKKKSKTKNKNAEPAKEPEPKTSSNELSKNPPVRLVAFQAEAADKPVAEVTAEVPATVAKETVAKETVAKETVAQETKEPGVAALKSEPAKSDIAPNADPASATITAETKPQEEAADAKKDSDKPMRTKTFEEVREDLRRELALEPAQKRMQAAISEVREAMELYSNQLSLFQTGDKKDPTNVAPVMPDLKSLGDKVGFAFGRTGMVDPIRVGSLPIGRSFMRIEGMRFDSFTRQVFDNRLRLFQVAESQTISSQTFVFWKTEEAVSRVPAFDEVRDEVVKAWNLAEARKLATKAAEELAGSINSTTESDVWSKVLDPSLLPLVLKPASFTYLQPMSNGNDGGQLSVVDQIALPGQAFMDKAFTTPNGKASVALDATQQKCFVIRVLERTPSDEEMLRDFERAPMNRGVQSLASQQVQMSASRWFDSLIRDMNLDMSKLGQPGQMNEE